jgi:hypothetical protein
MQSLSFAASTHTTNVASQLYLWIVSRINMGKLVQRSIQAAEFPTLPVKMVLAEYRYEDRLSHSLAIHTAMRAYGGPALASLLVPGTQAYIRRKPTAGGLSPTIYQLVLLWNVTPVRATFTRPPPLVIPPVPAHIARGPPSPIRPPGGSPRLPFNSPAHTPTATSDAEDFQNANE